MMIKKVLILTVGGSDIPVVTSVNAHRPDFVYFLCSDDNNNEGQKGSYHTVDGTGKPCGRIDVCTNCKSSSGEQRASIVSRTGLSEDKYTIIKIKNMDNLDDCYLTAGKIIKGIREDYPGTIIMADYTGGTKTMSSGLAAAAMDDGDVSLCVVKGKRPDLHQVKNNTQAARIIENNSVFVEKNLRVINRLWEMHYYQSCLEAIEKMFTSRHLNQNLQDRLDRIRYFCEGLEAWDRFDHEKAQIMLKPYEKLINGQLAFLGEILKVIKNWKGSKKAEMLTKNRKSREKLLSFAPVYDLLLNARRRENQGRYDDALARLYRAMEMFGQINLLRQDKPLDTADLDIKNLPLNLQEKYRALRNPSTGIITIALMQNYTLLADLATPVGKIFDRDKNKLQEVLSKRNQSLMAHGITPVTKEDYQDMHRVVMKFIIDCLDSLPETPPDMEQLQFPEMSVPDE